MDYNFKEQERMKKVITRSHNLIYTNKLLFSNDKSIYIIYSEFVSSNIVTLIKKKQHTTPSLVSTD